MSDIVRVAAAVIFSPRGEVMLAQRPTGKPYAGYWEFPGGKLEPGETPAHALSRELHEELGIVVREAAPWIVQEFVYPHAHVELHFFRVFAFDGEPHGHDGQAFAWQTPGAFDVAPLLPANTRVLAALNLPSVYGITCASEVGEDIFIERARASFASGVELVQLREKEWPPDRIARFSARLLVIARSRDVRVLLNGDEYTARQLGFDGVHWSSERLANAHVRPDDLIVGASCHDAGELQRAAKLGCDFAVLGPVQATPTHPNARLLGWDGFAHVVESTRIPVYALGGMSLADLHTARMSGAHGIAMRRGAW